MFYTKEKAVDKVAAVKLEEYLEDLLREAMETQDEEKELLLLSAYFVGYEALQKGTFMVIDCDDLPEKYIIVPGIPFEISENWSYRREIA